MPVSSIATFDLNLLRTLHVLLRERSVTRAAKELNVTQQAASGALKRIRQHFDDPILVRVGAKLEPTPLALALAAPVRDAMRQIADALDVAPALPPGSIRRRFRIAMSDHASSVLLPRLMADVAYAHPGISYDISPVNRRAIQDLDLGAIDVLVMPLGHSGRLYLSDNVSVLPLFEDGFVCIADGANASVGRRLSKGGYASMRHVALAADDGFTSIVEHGWLRAGISPRVVVTVRDFADMVHAVVGTELIATVHGTLAARYRSMAAIKILDCPVPMDVVHQHLHWHARNDDDPAHVLVRAAMLAASRSPSHAAAPRDARPRQGVEVRPQSPLVATIGT